MKIGVTIYTDEDEELASAKMDMIKLLALHPADGASQLYEAMKEMFAQIEKEYG